MKTWEMIKALTENPTLKFTHKNHKQRSYVYLDEKDRIKWGGESQRKQPFYCVAVCDDWESYKAGDRP